MGWELFSAMYAGDLSLESKWQQVSSIYIYEGDLALNNQQ